MRLSVYSYKFSSFIKLKNTMFEKAARNECCYRGIDLQPTYNQGAVETVRVPPV